MHAKSFILSFFMKHSNYLQKDESLAWLTGLASLHIDSTFDSANVKVTKWDLLRSFTDRINKILPQEEANLHQGMKIQSKPPLNTVPLALWKLRM
jgi:hypothetical protein